MNYWVTTHWPPYEDNPDMVAKGVWVRDGREEAAKELRKGDLVAVYQSYFGRTELRKKADGGKYRVRNVKGKGGVIALAEAQEALYALEESSPGKRGQIFTACCPNRFLGAHIQFALENHEALSSLKRICAVTESPKR